MSVSKIPESGFPETRIFIREELPKDGIVNVLSMNLENFKKMMTILGKSFNMLLISDDIIFLTNDANECKKKRKLNAYVRLV